ncbi:NB-ARC domain-containing protein [Amycolatopsis sp. NPDC051716]|uniref:ATP-binding protein n=1 Tax=Amycolatopsis sp. NPDC051716 TaxID=3155804 RepID=UPI003427F86A
MNGKQPGELRRKIVRIIRFVLLSLLAGMAAYAALAASSNTFTATTRLYLGIGSAAVVGILTALQIIPNLGQHSRITRELDAPGQRIIAQLPRDLYDFTGRSFEIDWLVRSIENRSTSTSAVVISAIAGQGGVGKTALAIHVAHLVADRFPHGHMYVNLRGPEAQALDPYDVLGGLLRELGVDAETIPATLEERSRLFRTILARMRLIIVLDNASNEAQVRPLLPGRSPSVVLITSRSRLVGLEGVAALRLDSMPQEEALTLLKDIVGQSRIDAEPDKALELIELCSRLPLAIRIAGTRLAANRHWTVSYFADRLNRQSNIIDELHDTERAVRATFDISYVDLSYGAQTLFRALGVLTTRSFPGWLFERLRPNTNAADSRDGLDELVRTEMIGFTGPDSFGVSRYAFHDILRDYSRDKLDAGSAEAIKNSALTSAAAAYLEIALAADRMIRDQSPRHTIYHRIVSSGAMTELVNIANGDDARRWMESELQNLLLLVAQLHTLGFRRQVLELATSLSAFCEERFYWREWETLQSSALDNAKSLSDDVATCYCLCELGQVHRHLGDLSLASLELDQAAALAGTIKRDDIRAAAFSIKGKIRQIQRRNADALALFGRARELYDQVGDRYASAYATANMGDIYHLDQNWAAAKTEFERCTSVFQEYGDEWWVANVGIWAGDTHRGEGEYDLATAKLRESLQSMRAIGDERRASVALIHLARTYVDAGDSKSALRAAGEALPPLERISDDWWQGMARFEMGRAYALAAKKNEALDSFRAALAVVEQVGNEPLIVEIRARITTLTKG